ncbi:uncharacterized protein BJ212DRAFT_1294658 [Suillus subaureus]|uniref:Uncharacterized protein n=1 Tax=Suillus subaureus TaxID=48587 RepID=A0A9P7EQF3_9AGAM|nr:uncharacterized protein BJ212DRAFT_1294658 [Suillus subaureus]KAG1827365.1 hypothetical protein BJ212DRAFT_1294658 [Suillus subaureus]
MTCMNTAKSSGIGLVTHLSTILFTPHAAVPCAVTVERHRYELSPRFFFMFLPQLNCPPSTLVKTQFSDMDDCENSPPPATQSSAVAGAPATVKARPHYLSAS